MIYNFDIFKFAYAFFARFFKCLQLEKRMKLHKFVFLHSSHYTLSN